MTPQTLWAPNAGPQTLLIQCPVFEVFYGGARGGGKTDGSIGDWLLHSAQWGEAAIGIFVRRKLTQLSEVIARTRQLFPKIGAKYNEQKKEWTMANGARLKFVYLERDADAENYQGHNYTRVYVEEATNFPSPDPINKLKATLRSSSGVPCAIRLTGNPGGPGHAWVKQRYILPGAFNVITEKEEVLLPDGSKVLASIDRVFIPARLSDNPKLLTNDPTYVLRLRQSGSAALVKAWLEGDWDEIEGAFFAEFDPDTHVIGGALQIPSWWPRFRAMDWGSAKPFSVGWYAVSDGSFLPRGALLKYREWYGVEEFLENGTPTFRPNVGLKLTAATVGMGVLSRQAPGEKVDYGVADPSIFITNGGPSIGEMMTGVGCAWIRADNSRQSGWARLRHLLAPPDGGDPLIYFHRSCEHTIRTFPLAQHDEKDPEDLDTDGEDHALDETRYAAMSRVGAKDQPQAIPDLVYPKLPGQLTFAELLAKQRRRNVQPSY